MSYRYTSNVGQNSDPLFTTINNPQIGSTGFTFACFFKNVGDNTNEQEYSVYAKETYNTSGVHHGFRIWPQGLSNSANRITIYPDFTNPLMIREINDSGVLDQSLVNNKWVCYTLVCTNAGYDFRILDCENNGNVLFTSSESLALSVPANYDPNYIARYDDFNATAYIAEEVIWSRPLDLEELQSFATTGFATKNFQPRVFFNREYMTGVTTNPAFDTDNPVDVLSVNVTGRGYDEISFTAFTVLSDAAKIVVYDTTAGPITATDADIWAGVGAEQVVDVPAPQAGVDEPFTITGLTPDTDYTIVYLHGAAQGYLQAQSPETTTKSLFELPVADVKGTPFTSLTDIDWAWFSTDTPNSFSTPSDKGTGISVDPVGSILRIGVDNAAAGQLGTMVLFKDETTFYRSASFVTNLQSNP